MKKRRTLGMISLIIGFGATLILPTLMYVQSRTRAAQLQHVDDFGKIYYWQGIRNIFLRSLLPSIIISFVAGWIVIFAFRGWKKLFGVVLILFSVAILLLSIPST